MKADAHCLRSALRKRGSGEKSWRENEQWEDSGDKDKSANFPFVSEVAGIPFGALFGVRRPGTDAIPSYLSLWSSLNFAA